MNENFYDFLSELVSDKVTRMKQCEQYRTNLNNLKMLSEKTQNILKKLPLEDTETINAYIDEAAFLADMDCKFLYISGAIDSIRLWELFRTL